MHTLRMRCGGGLAAQLRRPLAAQSSCAAGKSLRQKSGDFCHLPFQGRRGCARLFTESDNSRAANQVRGVSSFPGHEAVASFQNHMTYIRILNTQINIRKPPARGAGPARGGQLCPGNQERGETGAEQMYWCECGAECLWVRTSSAPDRRILYRHARRWSHRCCQWRRPERPCSYLWVQKRHWAQRRCIRR